MSNFRSKHLRKWGTVQGFAHRLKDVRRFQSGSLRSIRLNFLCYSVSGVCMHRHWHTIIDIYKGNFPIFFQKTQLAHGKHFASRNMQLSAYQQTERATKRTQVRPVVFTAPKETSVFHDLPQTNEFRSACSVMSTSKRLRQNSASNIYNTSPAAFSDNL